jgi:POT family proton-dependent oligopeptide transporter
MNDPNHNRHPIGFWFIFWGEFAERASFYGMKALLVLYMIDMLGYSDANSSTVASYFTAACYVLPIIGGYVADRWLGKFKTIIYFAIPYIMGHIVLGTWDNNVGLYVALALLAGGSGTIKPNISTLMGMMYEAQGKGHLLSQAFSWFYMGINIGAASSMMILPFIRNSYGYGAAFMAPTILMVLSLGVFYLGKRHYPVEDAKARAKMERTPEQKAEVRATLVRLSGLFLLIIFFWSVFDQAYSTWTLFARDHLLLDSQALMNTINLIPGVNIDSIPADAIQSLNPLLILLFTPFFVWLWRKTDEGERRLLTSQQKMLIGFVLVIISMAILSLAGFMAGEGRVSILWEFFAYVAMTCAELCISVIGLQLAFEEAPDHMKSVITGIFLATVAAGNFINGSIFVRLYDTTFSPGEYFALMAVVILVVTIIFYFVGKRFDQGKEAMAAHQAAQ